MRLRKVQHFAWILAFCAASAAAGTAAGFRPAAQGGVPGEYLVVLADGAARDPLRPGSSGPPVSDVARRLAGRYGGEVETSYDHALLGFSLRIGEAGARRLAADPAVRLVEQNAAIEVSAIDNCDPPFQGAAIEGRNPVNRAPVSPETIDCRDPDPIRRNGDPAAPPGEPHPNHSVSCIDNWGLDLIDGTRNERYDFAATGQGVHVYLIDLGLNQGHREFGSRVKRGFNAALPDNAIGIDPAITTDCVANSHGTHVAAIVGGNTFGVAKGAWLHPVQFEDTCGGHSYAGSRNSVIRGVDWIVRTHNHHPDQMGPAVVNFSGGNGSDASFRDGVMAVWVRRLLAAGISFVQSSGNQDNQDRVAGGTTIAQNSCANTLARNSPLRDALIVAGGIDEDGAWGAKSYHRWQRETGDPSYPICSPNTIHDCGSNFGPCVDIWAPAAHIVSAKNSDTASACRLSGTSMAAPHVTGVVALLLQRFPNASPATVKKALVANARLDVLQAGSIGDSPNRLLHSTFPTSGGPVAGDSWLSTPPGVPLTIFKNVLLRGGLDWSGDALQFSRIGTNEPLHGVLDESADRLTYTPHGGFSGLDSFTYTVSDGHGGSDTATVRIEVQAPPLPPVARDDCYAVPVRNFSNCTTASPSSVVVLGSQAGSFDFLTQGEGDVVSFAIIDPPDSGQIGSNELGVPRYCPPATAGVDTFRYRIRDSYHQAAEATVTFHVGGSCPVTNQAPTPQDDFFSTNYNTAFSFFASTLVANDTDPDGDPVSFAGLTSEPAHGFLSVDGVAPEDIIYRYHPNPGFVGGDSFGYQVADPSGATATATVHVTVTNTGFGGNPDLFVTTANGMLPILSSQLLANDSPGAEFLFAENARNGSLKIGGVAPEGVLYHFYPDSNFVGEAGFEYLISPDGSKPYTRVDVTIQVNDGPPVAGFLATCNGANCSFDASSSTDDIGMGSYVWNFGDGATGSGTTTSHTYAIGTYLATLTVTDTAGHTASAEQVVIADPKPVACFTSSCVLRSCTFNASCSSDDQPLVSYAWAFGDGTSGSGLSASHVYATGGPKAVTLTVTDSATQQATQTQSLALNRPPAAVADAFFVTINVPRDLPVLANDFDADGDPISVTTWTAPAHGSVVKNPNGTLRYTPHSGYLGGDSFTYQISDGKESAGPATVTLTVTPPNDAPDARDDGWWTYINGPTNIQVSHLLANDYDPNGDALTVTQVDATGLIGTLDCSSGSYCRYTPPPTFAGTTSFTYVANDGKGGTDPATVRIKVGGGNNAPAPQDDLLETTRNTPLAILRATLLANDADPDGDVLSVTSVYRATLTAFGTVTCSPAYYTCTYTPPAGFTGLDTIYYRASDGITFTDVRIRILVRPPVPAVFDAREDRLFTTTNPTYISYASLLANDYDPEGGALTVVSVDTAGLLGTLDCTTFTTGCDYYRGTNDPTRFKITVRDPQGNLDTSTVTVKPGNHAFNKVPVLGNDTLSAHRNTPLPFSVFDLLRNDVDPDNDQLDVSIYPFTANGRVNCTTPAYFCTYVPNTNFTGTDTFTYTAHDGTHAVTGTVTVSVAP